MTEQVRVIVVNWNGKDFLGECLASLRRQVFRSFSVTLVDNGSSDGSTAWVAEHFPEVRLVTLQENRGFAGGNNDALRELDTPYVALLNNDAVADPGWLQSLVDALERAPEAGFAASRMLAQDRPGVIDRCGDGYTWAGMALLRGRGEVATDYDRREWVFGACAGAALYRTGMLREVGTFDEDFFLLYEDVDLSFRCQLRGYRCLYVPEAIVHHRGSGSLVYDSPLSVYYGHRNLEWVYVQNMPVGLIVRTIFPHLLYTVGALVYFTLHGRGGDYLRAKRDALRGWKQALDKRRLVQSRRLVDNAYVWGLLERPSFLSRLKGRKRGFQDKHR
ncbi:MAG: glycosyltransferase family 2 protein [Syntrophaceae bacterium]|nr:glycosyltransferase family 2 protein [Syntrophaceae bacterium]